MIVTQQLCDMIRKYQVIDKSIWMNIHFNHVKELTPRVKLALHMLSNAGIPLGSQTVLLRGINDCANILKELFYTLTQNRVRPYYLYQADIVSGSEHFRTPVSCGLAIMEQLRCHIGGVNLPQFVVDSPGGHGKLALGPTYIISQSPEEIILRSYKGVILKYPEPPSYKPHNKQTCEYCKNAPKHNYKSVSDLFTKGNMEF
jgi:lysine 2,3-aminomutase